MKKLSARLSFALVLMSLLTATLAWCDSSPSELLQDYNLKIANAAAAKNSTYLYRTAGVVEATKAKIKELQRYLQAVGLYQNCLIDGWFGPLTELAVMEYQRSNKLSVTGVIDDKLFKKLSENSDSKQKSTAAAKTSNNKTSSTTNASALANSSFAQYLKPTSNCQSTNSKIVSLANSLKGATTYKTMANIFYYVRNRVTYSGYYNTRKGALGTLAAKNANCCDQAHLLIAMLRAAGIPARYGHATCRFRSGLQTGHVFAYAYVNGKWLLVDPVSTANQINSPTWSARSSIKTYTSLPF